MAHTNDAFWKFQVWDRVAWLFPLVDLENIFSSFKRKLNCHGFNKKNRIHVSWKEVLLSISG